MNKYIFPSGYLDLWQFSGDLTGVSPTLCIRELAGVLVKKGVAADEGY
jgi:hypothetical protein